MCEKCLENRQPLTFRFDLVIKGECDKLEIEREWREIFIKNLIDDSDLRNFLRNFNCYY